MKGIIVAGGSGTRLHPLTLAFTKHLLPVYNKPMIYYPLTTLMLAGVDEVLIICKEEDLVLFQKLLGDGRDLGIAIEYAIQSIPRGISDAVIIAESFIANDNFCLILGDNLLYGPGLGRELSKYAGRNGAIIFAYQVANPSAFGNIIFDTEGRVIKISEKPSNPLSNWAIPGIYFFDSTAVEKAKSQSLSERNELEIVDLINLYLTEGNLIANKLPIGTAWLDLGTPKSLLEAGQFIQVIEERQGIRIGDPFAIDSNLKRTNR